MSVNFVQQVQASLLGSASTLDAPSITPSAGSVLVCVVECLGAGTTMTLSDTTGSNGSWTSSLSQTDAGNFVTKAFYLVNAAATASTIRATFSPAASVVGIYVAEFSGVKTSGAFLAEASQLQLAPGNGADLVSSGLSGVLGAQPALIFGFTFSDSSPNATEVEGTGFTGLTKVWDYALGSGPFAMPEWKRVTSTASVAATWTTSVQEHHHNYLLAFAEQTAASITGTLDATESGDTASATGVLTVSGSLVSSDAVDVVAFTGTVTYTPNSVAGTFAATEQADVAEMRGLGVVRIPQLVVRGSTMLWGQQVAIIDAMSELDFVDPNDSIERARERRQPVIYPFNRNGKKGFIAPLDPYA